MDPGTGAFIGTSAQASLIVGTLVPGTGITTNGAPTNGLIPADTQGLPKTGVLYPKMGFAPRVGGAYTINQEFVVRGAAGVFIDRPSGGSTYSVVNNPPFSQNITVRYGYLQDIATSGLATQSAPSLSVFRYENKLPISIQWNGGLQTRLPFSSALDLTYTGQHSYNEQVSQNINTIDYGSAYLASLQDKSQATNGVTTSLVNTNPSAVRSFVGYSGISQNQPIGWHTFHSVQMSFTRRLQDGLSFGFNDTISLYDVSSVNPRLQHNPDGSLSIRSDQAAAQDLLGNNHPQTHVMRGNVIWQLPTIKSQAAGLKALGYLVNNWSVASIWSGSTGASYNPSYSYTSNGASIDITGSPDYGGRVVVSGDPGSGCSNDPLKAFNTAAFKGPSAGSVGLDSGSGYLRYCFQSKADVSLSRSIKIGEKGHAVSFRLDAYNAFNQAAVTGRNTQMIFASPASNTTITNLPYDANGNVVSSFSRPRGAGFGVANGFQSPRTMQVQLRYQF